MPHKSDLQLERMEEPERNRFLTTHIPIGLHPTTEETVWIPEINRHTGTVVIGGSGQGKSMFCEYLFEQDVTIGHAGIYIDPHGDSIQRIIRRLQPELLYRTYLLRLEDIDWPFILNFFNAVPKGDVIALTRETERSMQIFKLHWPDVMSQVHFPRYLRMAIVAVLSNPEPTLLKLYKFLRDDNFRRKMLKALAVEDETVLQFWQDYDELSGSAKRQQIDPVLARLEVFIVGRPIVRNILSHAKSSVNFTQAIKDGDIILISLDMKTMPLEAALVGSVIISHIHSALFGMRDLSPTARPTFTLVLDEWQLFCTPQIAEMLSEGRKYGLQLCAAGQYLAQLPTYLQEVVMAMGNKVCFRMTHDDAKSMAYAFHSMQTQVKPEDFDPHPITWLDDHGSDNPVVEIFLNTYVRPVRRTSKHKGRIVIKNPGFRPITLLYMFLQLPVPENPTVADPLPDLNNLLYEAMKTGNANIKIPSQIIEGFANCGQGFYAEFKNSFKRGELLSPDIQFPPHLVVQTENGSLRWTKTPISGSEQLYHCLFHLRCLIVELIVNPVGRKSTLTTTEIAQMLTQLPKRMAFVRSGDETAVIQTFDSSPEVEPEELQQRLYLIQEQTKQKFCRPRTEVEQADKDEPPDEPFSRSEVI